MGNSKRSQGYAADIEHEMEKVFKCGRGGIAGIVNSDFIRKNPLAAVLITCGYIYARVDDKKKKQIEKFIEDTKFYWEMSLDELLSFETSSKTEGIMTIELKYKDGETALIDISDKFGNICNLLDC